MVIKLYVALISCSQEVKKNQQRAVMVLESKNIPYNIIDITDPANEQSKDYMMETATPKEGAKTPVTPQIYNEADYCGDFDCLDMANETDTLGEFLKLSETERRGIKIGITSLLPSDKKDEMENANGSNDVPTSREGSPEKPHQNGVSETEMTATDDVEVVDIKTDAEEASLIDELDQVAVEHQEERNSVGQNSGAAEVELQEGWDDGSSLQIDENQVPEASTEGNENASGVEKEVSQDDAEMNQEPVLDSPHLTDMDSPPETKEDEEGADVFSNQEE